jgi:hypothetical protein
MTIASEILKLTEKYKVCMCPPGSRGCLCGVKRATAGKYAMAEDDIEENEGTVSSLGALPTGNFGLVGKDPYLRRKYRVLYETSKGRKCRTTVRAGSKQEAIKKCGENLGKRFRSFRILSIR